MINPEEELQALRYKIGALEMKVSRLQFYVKVLIENSNMPLSAHKTLDDLLTELWRKEN